MVAHEKEVAAVHAILDLITEGMVLAGVDLSVAGPSLAEMKRLAQRAGMIVVGLRGSPPPLPPDSDDMEDDVEEEPDTELEFGYWG